MDDHSYISEVAEMVKEMLLILDKNELKSENAPDDEFVSRVIAQATACAVCLNAVMNRLEIMDVIPMEEIFTTIQEGLYRLNDYMRTEHDETTPGSDLPN